MRPSFPLRCSLRVDREIVRLWVEKCGRVESNHHSRRQQGYSLLSSPMLGVRVERGDRPDSNRYREDHDLGCCRYTTATMRESGDDRTRTGDLSLDKRVLYAAELRPRENNGAGGIRTHGLELMR